jgi:hypothetical protein
MVGAGVIDATYRTQKFKQVKIQKELIILLDSVNTSWTMFRSDIYSVNNLFIGNEISTR